ncbi:PilZ domain-containing protein [Aurantivibrio plasticivorans]
MSFFKPKKPIKNKVAVSPARHLETVKRIISCFVIGGRVRYIVDFEETARLESLVIGYNINGHLVFQKNQVVSDPDHILPGFTLLLEDRQEDIEYIDCFSILIPSDIGEERKLDYQTRASLGRRGPFAVGKDFSLMSLNPDRENIRLNAEVKKNILLKDGIHAGHTVAQLDVLMGSVESYELRDAVRVPIYVAAKISPAENEEYSPAYVLDISEKALRFIPNPPSASHRWIKNNTKIHINVSLLQGRQEIVLRCVVILQRGNEWVANIEKIRRQGRFVEFETIDAMELKIALLNTSMENELSTKSQ